MHELYLSKKKKKKVGKGYCKRIQTHPDEEVHRGRFCPEALSP